MLYLYSLPSIKKQIQGLILFQDSLSASSVFFLYFIAGLFTKRILINAGDRHNEKLKISNLAKPFNKESIDTFFSHMTANLPLKSTIFAFIFITYISSDIKINIAKFPELFLYMAGLFSPHFNKIFELYRHIFKNKECHAIPESNEHEWYQQEEPIKNINQDKLNRTAVVSRMCDIIVNSKIKDSRGIALIAAYGMGKSSTINMVVESINQLHDNYIICRVDAWGVYSSDEQIQKYIIERLIKSLSTVVSTTNLSGLPTKYISSLKGAQSLWLDALPLFDNYSSPVKQCDQINNILERINHNIVFIIEDLDRNKEAITIFNSIAPLIENLNGNGRIKVIISIGDALNEPQIINRICRYKEFLIFDKDQVYNHIQKSVTSLLKESKFPYHCSISHFFKRSLFNNSAEYKVRQALFSYIETPRDLKILLTQFSYDWTKSLKGSCDILDLLAITILKHHEDNLIKSLLLINNLDIEFSRIETQLKNKEAAEIIFNYFFKKNNFSVSRKRLQSCSKDYNKYFTSIVNRAPSQKNAATHEKVYFEELYDLINECKEKSDENKIIFSIRKILSYVDIDTFKHDLLSIKSSNAAAPFIVLYCQHMIEGKNSDLINDVIIMKLPDLIKGMGMTNNELLKRTTKMAACSLINDNLTLLDKFYENISKAGINRHFVYTHNFELIMSSFITQGQFNFKGEIDYQILELFISTYSVVSFSKYENKKKNKKPITYGNKMISWLHNDKSELSMSMIAYIKRYKFSSGHSQKVEYIIEHLKREIDAQVSELTNSES